MKFFGILVTLLVVTMMMMPSGGVALPSSPYRAPFIPILKDDRTQDRYGGYTFSYKTGNGIDRHEAGRQNYGQNTNGGWSYTSPDGVRVSISFVADQGGYQPEGSVIPTSPPLPYSRTQRY